MRPVLYEQSPLVQVNPPQQPALKFAVVQTPPAFRQQFSPPSPESPLSAQTTAPPTWLHCPAAVQAAPTANVPVPAPPGGGAVPPPQTPPVQVRAPQHCAGDVHAPPLLRQQVSTPSDATPLSAQVTGPPAWLHWLAAVHGETSGKPPVLARSVQIPLRQ